MKKIVAIVHPFSDYVKYEEKNARHAAERWRYNEVMLEEKLDIFKKYKSDKKIVILPSEEKDIFRPRLSLMTNRINLRNGDLALSDMNPYSQLKKSIYPDWDKLASFFMKRSEITTRDNIIVGGYSIDDCVEKFIWALERKGLKPLVDPNITNLYYLCLRDVMQNRDPLLDMKIKTLKSLDRERKNLQKIQWDR